MGMTGEIEFRATLTDGRSLRLVLDALKEFMREAPIICTPEGISIGGMDNSHVCVVQVMWKKNAFKSYECNSSVALGLQFETFLKVVKIADPLKELTLIKEARKDVLRIQFGAERENSFFDIKLLDLENDPLEITDPDENNSTAFTIQSLTFQSMVGEFLGYGDCVNFQVLPKGIKWHVNGDSGTGGRFVKQHPSSSKLKVKRLVTEVNDEYNLKYLHMFCRAVPLTDEITFTSTPGEPMAIRFPIHDLNYGHMTFYLAPKSLMNDGTAGDM